MPVNEKILFRSIQYLFSLKIIIYAILSLENHAVLGGKNIDFGRGGGINIPFRPKYRPLHSGLPTGPMRRRCWRHAQCSASPTRQVGFWIPAMLYCTGTHVVTVRAVDPDPAFQVNPDPIRIQGFDDQKRKKKIQ
jgi:hypothetical protein